MAMGFQHYVGRAVATNIVAADGTGDFTDIQEAINDLPAGGGVVYIKEGTYTITSAITINSNNISLIGAGKSTKIITSSNIRNISVSSCSGILIDSIWIYGAGASRPMNNGLLFVTVTDSMINNCWVENCSQPALYLSDCSGVLVQSNHVFDNLMMGAQLTGSNSCIINQNSFYDNLAAGLIVTGNRFIVTNNKVEGNGDKGIYLNAGSDCIVSNNVIKDNDFDGIYLAYNSDNNIITSNRSQDNRYEINISSDTCDKNLVCNNICLGTHTGAIEDSGTNTNIAHNITS